MIKPIIRLSLLHLGLNWFLPEVSSGSQRLGAQLYLSIADYITESHYCVKQCKFQTASHSGQAIVECSSVSLTLLNRTGPDTGVGSICESSNWEKDCVYAATTAMVITSPLIIQIFCVCDGFINLKAFLPAQLRGNQGWNHGVLRWVQVC